MKFLNLPTWNLALQSKSKHPETPQWLIMVMGFKRKRKVELAQ